MKSFETFLQLHHNENLLLIGNAWDANSAKIFERGGLKAIATSSKAIANSMGYEDGENIPFDLLLQTAKTIAANINIPLSVDIESGYGRAVPKIIENIEKLHEIGVVGFNIEDSVVGETGKLQPLESFQKIIAAITNHLEKNNMRMFLNARTDTYLQKLPSPLAETLKRIKAYEGAGATGIFVPFIPDNDDIKKVTEATSLPVNVVCMKGLPDFKTLSGLGVKRISMGSGVYNYMMSVLEKTIASIQQDGSFNSMFK